MAIPSASALIVPIDVAALCIGDRDAHQAAGRFGDIAADFSRLPYQDANGNIQNAQANIAAGVLPRPLNPAAAPPPRGIHLHWALPDALTRGASDGSGRLRFRAAPNRWLVVRIAGGWADPAHPTVALAAWVVESDQLWDQETEWSADPASGKDALPQNGLSRAVPWTSPDGTSPKPYAFLGRVYPLAGWSEGRGAHYAAELTALGYGTLEFAAAYPHCPNVFGFYDPATDLASAALAAGASSLSYAVIGWYRDLNQDPLAALQYPAGATTLAARIAALETAFGWTLAPPTGASGGAADMPGRVLCHGLLHGVAWHPDKSYLETHDGKGIEVAVGNTTAEALSALLARRHPDVPGVETLLNLFQLGLLTGLGQPGALSDADEDLHQAGFGTRSGGTIWSIVRRTAANSGTGAPVNLGNADVLAAAAAVAPQLSDQASELLNTLNLAQQQADGQRFEFQSRQRQLFADWYKYMLVEYPPPMGPPTTLVTPDQAFQYVRDEVTSLLGVNESTGSNDLAGVVKLRDYALSADPAAVPPAGVAATVSGGLLATLVTLRAGIAASRANLESELGNDFMVVPTEAPRYWQANDPVLLLSGGAMRPSPRYGGDGSADPQGRLRCRTPAQVMVALTAGDVHIGAGDLPALPAGADIPRETAALVAEATLVDPDRAWLLADAVARRSGGTLPGGADRTAFTASLQAAQKTALEGTPASGAFRFAGAAPSPIGINAWTQPWIPLLLQWEVELHPPRTVGYPIDPGAPQVSADYPPNAVAGSYTLDDDEVELRASAGRTLADAARYSGSLVLAASAEVNLQAQLEGYLDHNPTDPFAAELKQIAANLDVSAMAQTLSGFNEALQMRAQTLQLQVGDPLASGIIPPIYAGSLFPAAIGRQNRTAPQPEQRFNPLRAGQLRLSRLRVLDAFGQIREIIDVGRIDGSVANPTPAVTDRLRPAAVAAGDPAVLELPPRIAQPARLLFRWLSATDNLVETNSHPAASPICGWVLFNQLDDSLMVYDAAGTALGSLNVQGPSWQDAPGAGAPTGDPIARAQAALQGANPHLRAFVMGVLQRPQSQAYLAAMLDAIDRQMTGINPLGFKQDQGLSLLIGQPLALARASVRLEVMGLRALDESWAAFAAALSGGRADEPDTMRTRAGAGLGGVTFPLRLGDLGLLDDGLVGYFVGDDANDGTAAAYGTFHASAMNPALPAAAMAADPTHGVIAPDPSAVALTAAASGGDATAGRILSLLLDPRGVVHATTGILPVKAISVPDDMYSDALARMAVTFLASPVLGNPGAFAAPLPREHGYGWSWVTRNPGTAAWSEAEARSPVNIAASPAMPQHVEEGWLRLRKVAAADKT